MSILTNESYIEVCDVDGYVYKVQVDKLWLKIEYWYEDTLCGKVEHNLLSHNTTVKAVKALVDKLNMIMDNAALFRNNSDNGFPLSNKPIN